MMVSPPIVLIAQDKPYLCWDACARMMWLWKWRNLTGYRAPAAMLADMNGANHEELNSFYHSLGMRSLRSPRAANIHHALKWSPVVLTVFDNGQSHAVVAIGFSGGTFQLANPCSPRIQFADDDTQWQMVCVSGNTQMTAAEVEGGLGRYIWYW